MKNDGDAGASRILILGDDSLCKEGLYYILRSLQSAPEVDRVDTLDQLQANAAQNGPYNLVFVSALPLGADYAELVRAVKESVGPTPVAVLALTDSAVSVRGAISAGASGYVPAMASPRVIRHAAELMLSGGVYLPASVLGPSKGDGSSDYFGQDSLVRLTTRQEAVLGELAKGHSNKRIAKDLGLSEATVKVHVAAIMRTLKAQNRTQAVLTATQVGILDEQQGP